MDLFHNLLIPFLGGFAQTLAKLIADQKLFSFDDSNDIALDLVMLAVGALGAFYIKVGKAEAAMDAGVGDAFLGAILLYVRFARNHAHTLAAATGGTLTPVGKLEGLIQLTTGCAAVEWTVTAF